MSLPEEPVFSMLKNDFVCGTRDIKDEPYCGRSGQHDPTGKSINTTNGAGPHNLQLFVLAPDGTVMHCLPGYWSPQDLAHELTLAKELYQLWQSPGLSKAQKDQYFKQMQLAHVNSHSPTMVRRSRMQSFDQQFEAKHRPYNNDTVKNPQLAIQAVQSHDNKLLNQAFKTTDEIVHARMAARPFVSYSQFDVAKFTDYGKQRYDKNEDRRDELGRLPPKPEKMQKRMNNGNRRRMQRNA